jgi:hypothetical protein
MSEAAPDVKQKTTRFRHITWRQTPKQQGWLVQVHGKTVGGLHKSLTAACLTLRKELRLPAGKQLPLKKKYLPKAVAPKGRKGLFGVSFHKGVGGWVGNKVKLGRVYKNQEDAHKRLCQILRKKSANLPKGYQRTVPPRLILERVLKLQQYGSDDRYLPPDLLCAFQHHTNTSKDMFADEPGLAMLSHTLKYDPWKTALHQCWRQAVRQRKGKMPSRERPLPDRAAFVAGVALETCKSIRLAPVKAEWPANANRFRDREQGPAMAMKNLGFVPASAIISVSA